MSSSHTVRREDIRNLYLTRLGRPAHQHEIDNWLQQTGHGNYTRTMAEIESLVLSSPEYIRRHTNRESLPYSVHEGEPIGIADADIQQHFSWHGSDYISALIRGGEYNTSRTRQNVLNWLTTGSGRHWVNPEQAAGSGGIIDEMSSTKGTGGQIHTRWGDPYRYPESGQYFSKGDLLATRAMGFSEREIQNYLDANPDVLKDHNKPGETGGVYEAVRSGSPITWDTPNIETTYHQAGPWAIREPNLPPTPQQVDTRVTDSNIPRQSLRINPSNEFGNQWGSTGLVGQLKPGSGDVRRRIGNPRPKYTSTKDLSREMRNSLNIS